jgi:hypothetical protein
MSINQRLPITEDTIALPDQSSAGAGPLDPVETPDVVPPMSDDPPDETEADHENGDHSAGEYDI